MKEDGTILRIDQVKKYYPRGKTFLGKARGYIRAVDGVSISVRRGECLGLVGESGSGKSTLGRVLAGLERPTEGKVYFEDLDLTDIWKKENSGVRTKLAMIFQDAYSSLNPRKRIIDILTDPMRYHRICPEKDLYQEALRLLTLVGLHEDALGRFPFEFSGGQRQRICIARALSLRPELIICDEITSALDVSIQAQILNLMKELKEELQLSMIFIGHGLGAVRYVSDRLAVMYLGKIVEEAEADRVFISPAHPYTKALSLASPEPDPDKRREASLSGELDPEIPETGCSFRPRCLLADESCRKASMDLVPCGDVPGHVSACLKGI